jgi:L-idonate 5-dehydrogenase
MRAFALHGPRDLREEDRMLAQPGPEDVVIAVRRAGICGSDVHYYEHFRIGDFVPRAPLVLGHEFAGEVVSVGELVRNIAPGDRVTVEPSIECRSCRYCRAGRYNLCENLRFIGTAATVPHIDGAFAEQVVAPARNCLVLPDGLDYAAGALAEPLAVGTHAVMRAGPLAGARILVSGGGTIGQMVLQAVRAMGGGDITLVDPSEFAREFAVGHGATRTVTPSELADAAETRGYDVLFEASGSPAALAACLTVTARGARLIQIGTQPDRVELPVNLVMARELTLLGSFRYAHAFPVALDMMAGGRVDVADLVTETYPFDELSTAMQRAASREAVVKVQMSVPE